MSYTQTSTLRASKLNFDSTTNNGTNIILDNVQFQPIYDDYSGPGDDTRSNVETIGFQVTKITSNLDNSGNVLDSNVAWTDLYTKNTFILGNITHPKHAITKEYLEDFINSNADTIRILEDTGVEHPNLYANIDSKQIYGDPSKRQFIFTINSRHAIANVGYDPSLNLLKHHDSTFGETQTVLFKDFGNDLANIQYNSLFKIESISANVDTFGNVSSNIEMIVSQLSAVGTIEFNNNNNGLGIIPLKSNIGQDVYDVSANLLNPEEFIFTKRDPSNIDFDQSNIGMGSIVTLDFIDGFTQSFVVTNTDNANLTTGNIENGNTLFTRIYTGTIASQNYDDVNITGGNVTGLFNLSAGGFSNVDGNISSRFYVDGNTGYVYTNNTYISGNVTDPQHAVHKSHFDLNTIKLLNNKSNVSETPNIYNHVISKEQFISNDYQSRYKLTMNVDSFDPLTSSFTHGDTQFSLHDIVLFSEFNKDESNIEFNGLFAVEDVIVNGSNIEVVLDKLSGSSTVQDESFAGSSAVLFLNGQYDILSNIDANVGGGNVNSFDFVRNNSPNVEYFNQSNVGLGTIITDKVYNQTLGYDTITSWVVTSTDNNGNVEGNVMTATKYTGTIAQQDFDKVHITGGNVTTLHHLSAAFDPITTTPRFTVDGDTGFCVAVNFTANSDKRLKENVENITGALDLVHNMNGKLFDWKGKENPHKSYGFIAQEIEEYFPSLVETSSEGENLKSVDYMKISAILVEAVKELKSEINTLKSQINM